MSRIHLFFFLFVLLSPVSQSATDIKTFNSQSQDQLYHQLINELRCFVCQNQNIADSDADLAKYLRQKTYELVIQNQNADQIRDYMRKRFGNFILYSTPLNASTLFLWGMPALILIVALGIFLSKLKRPKTSQSSSH